MPNIDQHPVGNFCWYELATRDQQAARQFYTALFAWSVNDIPMGDGNAYSIFRRNGRDAGAAYTLNPQQVQLGVPPHWGVYVRVDTADEAAAKASSLGGKVIAPAFDVFDVGRMSVLQDPAGAVFMVWQPRAHAGAGVVGENGTVCWSELLTTDVAGAKAFYSGLFGWTTKDSPDYIEWVNGGQPIGGLMQIRPDWGPVPPNWGVYFQVDDIDAYTKRGAGLGAKVEVPPTKIDTVGRFAVLSDPQSARFSMIQLEHA